MMLVRIQSSALLQFQGNFLSNHDEVLPLEALLHRRVEGEGRGARFENRTALPAPRSPDATRLEGALHKE